MITFLVTLLVASAQYNPYVRPLRATHAQKQFGGYPSMFGGFEWGDMEDYLPFLRPSRGQKSNSGSSSSGSSSSGSKNRNNPFSSFMRPYMNNPFGMNAQKCMDNDMCKQYIGTQMYGGASRAFGGMGGYGSGFGGYGGGYSSNPSFGPSSSADSGTTSTSGEVDSTADSTISDSGSSTDSGSYDSGSSTESGSSSGSSGSSSGSSKGRGFNFSPAMFGFPPGFNPMTYGLDWDSRPVDCMDDSKCARGLMMYTRGGSSGGRGRSTFTVDPRVVNFASNLFGFPTLQKPRLANYYGAHNAYHY